MSFEIKRATRTNVKPLIGLYSESGCGKTYSALLLARGLAGPAGRIVMVDSESGRGSLYADVIAGGYDALEIQSPFSSARYIQAIDVVEKSGATVGIIDSASHEWEGIGGVCDVADDNETKSGKSGLHNWKAPKMEHAKFVLRLLQSSIPWIVCLRAKYKTRQTKENGKTVIVKDDATSPIQAEDFIFECTVHAEILQNHSVIVTKCSHPALRQCFPEDKKDPISTRHGELLAKWCSDAGKFGESKPVEKAATKPVGATDATRQWMAKKLEPVREQALQFAIDKGWIMPNEGMSEWPLKHVPTTTVELAKLMKEIEAHI